MPASWRERVDTASAIKGILDTYPGNSILRELLQNSDDAGATKQVFVFDCRQHATGSLIDKDLQGSQGPALLAMNDSVFTDSDWEAVRTIHGSNKTADENKTGKYGLGMRACYHITDNLHILSGNKLVVFDPHERFNPYDGGATISVEEESRLYEDQLSAFSAIVPDFEIASYHPFTVVRLPLRTPAQAQQSKIKPISMSTDDIRQLYDTFVKKELRVALLFLKHVASIELRWIDANGNNTLFAAVEILNRDVAEKRSFVHGNVQGSETYQLDIKSRAGQNSFSDKWRILHNITAESKVQELMEQRLSYDIGDRLHRDKLSSHVAVAFPLSFQGGIKGQLFTLLPLPITTHFPLHIHGIFALTPDRQSLRNPEELGIGSEARERFLVEWNRVAFEEFIPRTWLKLLEVLVTQDEIEDIWSAWPPDKVHVPYWGSLLNNFTKLALSESSACIFPEVSGSYFISPCSPALLASVSDDEELLEAVAKAEIYIIRPPTHIFRCICQLGFMDSGFVFFDAPNLQNLLRSQLDALVSLDVVEKDRILNYLVLQSPRDVDYVLGLPLIPLANTTSRVSLSNSGSSSVTTYVLATADEVFLFNNCDKQLIALDCLPSNVGFRLQRAVANRTVNVSALGSSQLMCYLTILFGGPAVSANEIVFRVGLPGIKWFTTFWKWIDDAASELFKTSNIMSFHLLPTVDGHLRSIKSKVVLPISMQNPLYEILKRGGVPFLNPCIESTSTLYAHKLVTCVEDIRTLIEFLDPSSLVESDLQVLQAHIITSLQSDRNLKLDARQLAQFRQFPIFPILVSKTTAGSSTLTSTILAPASGHLEFVSGAAKDFPLPIVRGTTFIDTSGQHGVLATAINSSAISCSLNEVRIMELAARHISKQPHFLQFALLSRIIPRLPDLMESTRKLLRNAKVIPVVGSSLKLASIELIDPMSPLAKLFEGERNKFPADPYSTNSVFLWMMSIHGFFRSTLTSEIVAERIRYIASTESDPARLRKAEALLRLMDEKWDPCLTRSLESSMKWIPTTRNTLASRHDSRDVRDGETQYLFDLVLDEAIPVRSDNIRHALGWTPHIKFDILKMQLQQTLYIETLDKRPERMVDLIKYIAFEHASERISGADVRSLKSMIADEFWVPVSSKNRAIELVSIHHAHLLADLTIGTMFRPVSPKLTENPTCLEFLRCMGCRERPTIDALLQELTTIRNVHDSISLLSEIAMHGPVLDDNLLQQMCILDCDGISRSWSNIYFDDLPPERSNVGPGNGAVAAHPSISRELAVHLRLNFLSGLCLDEDDDDLEIDEEDMSENFVTRIKKVLVDYDAQYSCNEFLANAADAGANVFKVFVDRRSFDTRYILCNEMVSIQQSPSMLLYNDATFSCDDFKGIRNIGEGGKSSVSGTIGKFGLGALSFYHFADVALIISGDFIMILDPAAVFLPRRRGRRRCSFWCKLTAFSRKYHDHLAPFHGVAGFSSGMKSYPGTLIRLPLRQSASPLSNTAMSFSQCFNMLNGPYYDLSRDALYFTCLQEISAWELDCSASVNALWSIQKKNTDCLAVEHGSRCNLDLAPPHGSKPTEEEWLIVRSRTLLADIPVQFNPLIRDLKLLEGISISISFYLGHGRHSLTRRQFYLFSGLRLPEMTSLPIHIDAAFAVSSDRRSVRLDPPDGAGQRVLQSEYNTWLLSDIIPPLYLRGLEQLFDLLPRKATFTDWWPRKPVDEISRQITQSFYAALPQHNRPVVPTVFGNLTDAKDALFSGDQPELVTEYLKQLKVPEFVVLSPSIMALMPKKQLQVMNANLLVDVLSRPSIDVEAQRIFNASKLSHPRIIDDVLKYVLESPCSGHRLRLLITSDNMLQCFNHCLPVYVTPHVFPKNLFPPNRFLSNVYSLKTQALLVASPEYSVQDFNANAILSFLQTTVGPPKDFADFDSCVGAWITLFWKHWEDFDSLSDSLTLDTIKKFPLFPTYDDGRYVSLSYCLSGRVLPPPRNSDIQYFIPVMQSFNIPVLRHHRRLSESESEVQQFSFGAFLRCISLWGVGDKICVQEGWLVEWVKDQIAHISLHDLDFDLLARLPLWRATRYGRIQCLSANEVQILPPTVNLDKLRQFLDPNKAIAEYSSSLIRLSYAMKRGREIGVTTFTGFEKILRLPASIASQDILDYAYLITTMQCLGWRGQNESQMLVPDGTLTLRSVRDLFNFTVQAFSAAFRHCEDTMFMHPQLRHLQSDCGLISVVTIDNFLQCAQAIDRDARLNRDGTIERAGVIYNHYNNVLPQQIMSNQTRWRTMDELRFIPRKTGGLQNTSYDPEPYKVTFPSIIAPNEALLERFYAIAWTQRARFQILPTQNLTAVYPALGVPTAEEVVAHLVVLATKVAVHHPNNRALLGDLQSTYMWLQDHRSDARIALLKCHEKRIFLNVVNTNDEWEWRSANELVLDLRYNSKSCFAVETFLLTYKELLVTAGVRIWHNVSSTDQVEMGDPNFERLRKAGKMIDFHFRPLNAQPGEEEDSSRLGAHAVFLASRVPHLEIMLTGGWKEREVNYLDFPGTYFGASVFLDLLYTGDITIATRPQDGDAAMRLLQNLLEMLPVFEMWDLPSFKKKVAWLISSKFSLIDPDTHAMIRSFASENDSQDLVDVCDEFVAKNNWVNMYEG